MIRKGTCQHHQIKDLDLVVTYLEFLEFSKPLFFFYFVGIKQIFIIEFSSVFTTQQEPGVVQIPIGNNTGSLPDLTNFQFSQPIHVPLDQDDQYNLSSPYNSNVRSILYHIKLFVFFYFLLAYLY